MFDRATAKSVQARAVAALKKEFGSEFAVVDYGGSLKVDCAILKFEFRKQMTAKETKASEKDTWNKWCEMYGLKPSHFGKRFRGRSGRVFTIKSLEVGGRKKYRVLGQGERGGIYQFTVQDVLAGLKNV